MEHIYSGDPNKSPSNNGTIQITDTILADVQTFEYQTNLSGIQKEGKMTGKGWVYSGY